MIAILDYGMGNLKSVLHAFERLGAKAIVTSNPQEIKNASKVVLPGVGAFGRCMENLQAGNLVRPILDSIQDGKWFLGICLGLQLLFEESEEFGPVPGLSILPGKVKRFQLSDASMKVPHMGWNGVNPHGNPVLFKNLPDGTPFYFVHSYYVEPAEANVTSTLTDYGIQFCSSVQKENVLGCQFHPEKSQQAGLTLLKNFIELN